MEPRGQSPWYLHKIPSYAKASEGYPPSAKSAEAAILQLMNNSGPAYAFIQGQSPRLHAEVPVFAERPHATVSARRRGLLRRRINGPSWILLRMIFGLKGSRNISFDLRECKKVDGQERNNVRNSFIALTHSFFDRIAQWHNGSS